VGEGPRLRRLLAAALLFSLGCAHTGEVDIATLASSSDQILWDAGRKATEKHNWDSARKIYKRIIDGFPQSQYGPAARLALADSHFQEGGNSNYILAISEYRDFLTLYPSHPKSTYAQFQLAEAFYKQRNSPDRDQTPTEKALDEFQRLLELYPDSPEKEKARERVKACRQSLARHEFQVGYFYQHSRKAYRAAIIRYEGILKNYPDYDQADEVLYHMAEALFLSGRTPEALPQLQKLLDTYPQSPFAVPARQLLQHPPTTVPPLALPSPAPSPSPVPTPASEEKP
jgi:outer membrane protein assembly factor BamD